MAVSWKKILTTTDVNDGSAIGDLLYWDGNNWAKLAAGTSGKLLQANGSGSAPTWETIELGQLKIHKLEFAWDDGATVAICTLPAQSFVVAAYLQITEAYNEACDMSVGYSGDNQGVLSQAQVDATTIAWYGANHDQRGVLLYDAFNGHSIDWIITGSTTINLYQANDERVDEGAGTVYIVAYEY